MTISPAAVQVLKQELGLSVDLEHFNIATLGQLAPLRAPADAADPGSSPRAAGDEGPGELRYYHFQDFMAPIASGSFLTDGMVVCPCSTGTLSAIVHGTSGNLIQRAADVHLKERRKLILVPRETPLSIVQLDNMRRAAEAGAVILPAMPGFYHGVNSVQDLVDFIVARICDQLGLTNALIHRWGTS